MLMDIYIYLFVWKWVYNSLNGQLLAKWC
jgi:hypothetical protein